MKEYKGYKYCSGCECVLPIILFTRDKYKKDGLDSMCRDCNRESHKRYRERNKEKVSISSKIWYNDNKNYWVKWHKEHLYSNAEVCKKYRESPKGKENQKKQIDRRKKMGNVILFSNPFDCDCDMHHINDMLRIPIPMPREAHRKCSYSNDIDEHRKRCNVWLCRLYGVDFNLLLSE